MRDCAIVVLIEGKNTKYKNMPQETTDTGEVKLLKLSLGEIFECTLKFVEILNEETITEIKSKLFFIQVNKDEYYLIYFNKEENNVCFLDEIEGMKYNGETRLGVQPFSRKEAIEYVKSRKAIPTNTFIYDVFEGIKITPRAKNSRDFLSSLLNRKTAAYEPSF